MSMATLYRDGENRPQLNSDRCRTMARTDRNSTQIVVARTHYDASAHHGTGWHGAHQLLGAPEHPPVRGFSTWQVNGQELPHVFGHTVGRLVGEGAGASGGSGGLMNGFGVQHVSPSYPRPAMKHDWRQNLLFTQFELAVHMVGGTSQMEL